MKCPTCGAIDTRVVDSRPAEEATILRRRRHCDACGGRFTTHERLVEAPLLIVKKDGRREEFQPAKLRGGLLKACNKRPVSSDQIDHLIDAVEKSLRSEAKGEINAELIGERVMEQLIQLDQVAYVRFASVYQRFDDVRRFAQLLDRMSRRKRSRNQRTEEKSSKVKEAPSSASPPEN
jgi:transcriptional repressor NrdR